MESFNFIESALVLNIKDHVSLNKALFSPDDFSVHSAAFKFLLDYVNEFQDFPTTAALTEKFNDLDIAALDVNIDYAISIFRKQLVYRRTVTAVRTNQALLREDPVLALGKISTALEEISVLTQGDVESYGQNADRRVREYTSKRERRLKGLSIIGIPTMLRSINNSGIGWLSGDLVSIYSRPWVGKSWCCVKSAALAATNGHRTLFISSEMPKHQMELRMDVVLANMHGYNISHTALRKGEGVDVELYKEFLQTMKDKVGGSLFECDNIAGKSLTMPGIAALVRQHKPEFIVLDAIHLVSSNSKQVWEKMFNLFYDLKNICVAKNAACLVTTQANREVKDIYTSPNPSEVAFGDAMLQCSDVVLALSSIKDDDKLKSAVLHKYRDGELPFKSTLLHWDVDRGIIKEVD